MTSLKKGVDFSKIKFKVFLIIEIIICFIFLLNCFSPKSSYKINNSDFNSDSVDLKIKSGAYEVTIDYESHNDNKEMTIDDFVGKLSFSSENSRSLTASSINLPETKNRVKTRIWVNSGLGIKEQNVTFKTEYNSNASIKNITLQEQKIYRVFIFFVILLFFIILDLLYLSYCRIENKKSSRKWLLTVAGIALITAISSVPAIISDLSNTNDFNFHLMRIASLSQAIKEHQIPHRIQFEMLNGYGYATPLFYGEIFLLPPALMYNCYVPLMICYKIFIVMVNFANAGVCYWCCNKISGKTKINLFCSALYTFSAYRFVCILERGAVGEYVAMIFLPLLVYGLWNIYSKSKDDKILFNDYLPIIISATCIIQTHILSCLIVLIFALPVLLFNPKTYRKNIILSLIKSAFFILLLNLWFIIPFLQSMSMPVSVNDNSNFTDYFDGRDSISVPLLLCYAITGGIPYFSIFILTILILFNKKNLVKKSPDFYHIIITYVIGLISLFFVTDLMKWKIIPELVLNIIRKIQFPYRFFCVFFVMFTFTALFVMKFCEDKYSKKIVNNTIIIISVLTFIFEGAFVFDMITIGNSQIEYRVNSASDLVCQKTEQNSLNIACGEYILNNEPKNNFIRNDVLHGDNIINSQFNYVSNGVYHLNCENTSDENSYVDVPVQAYDNYHAYRQDNGEELEISYGELSHMRILVPAEFKGNICLKYEVPLLWRICEIISLISFVLSILFTFCKRKYIKKILTIFCKDDKRIP